MHYVYILKSVKDQKFYVGYTDDLKKRIARHEKGEVGATKFRRPFRLVCYEAFSNKRDALSREKFLKSGFGKQQIEKMLKNSL